MRPGRFGTGIKLLESFNFMNVKAILVIGAYSLLPFVIGLLTERKRVRDSWIVTLVLSNVIAILVTGKPDVVLGANHWLLAGLIITLFFALAVGLKWLCFWHPQDRKELEALRIEQQKRSETKTE
jgi:cell division protein FtsW (lipid II flippase)